MKNPAKTRKAISQLKSIEKLLNKSKLRLAAEFPEKWQILTATILSAMTRDETTIEISEKLFKKYPSLISLSKAPVKEIKKIIKPVNYYKTKAKNVKNTAKIIIDEYNGSIPNNITALLELPGVGRKVANVYLVAAHNTAAIGVDTHVSFLSQKLGWTKNKVPGKIEKDLEKLFPRRYWNSINWILVRFGRIYSTRKKQIEKLKLERII